MSAIFRSLLIGLCCLLPLTGFAQEDSPSKEKKAKPALPFKKNRFAVQSAQPLNGGSVAFFGEMGYPFLKAGVLYGIGGALNVGVNFKSEWTLTVGGDAQVMLGLIKRRNHALALKGEAGFLTLGAGDPNVLAFGPGRAGLNDGERGGLPHAFAATSHLTFTPQLVYSYRDSPGTWFFSGGVTIQQFLDALPDTGTQETSFMPRVSVGLEQVVGSNISFHFNTLAGLYFDANELDAAGEPTKNFIGMLQVGLNLFLP